MPKHLFAETIFTQPTCVIDLIQSYSLWAEKNISYRTVYNIVDLNIFAKEYVEEFVIGNLMVTVKTIIYSKNPSIVIIESRGSSGISKIDMIMDDYDQTYLLLPEAIKIVAGRNVLRDLSGDDPPHSSIFYNPFISIVETYETSNRLIYSSQILKIPKPDFADTDIRDMILEFRHTQWTGLHLEDTADENWYVNFPNNDSSLHIYSNLFEATTKELCVFDLRHFEQ